MVPGSLSLDSFFQLRGVSLKRGRRSPPRPTTHRSDPSDSLNALSAAK